MPPQRIVMDQQQLRQRRAISGNRSLYQIKFQIAIWHP